MNNIIIEGVKMKQTKAQKKESARVLYDDNKKYYEELEIKVEK